MTPDLTALVLSQSLPVRLALLDAGINVLGWPVSGTYRTAGNPIVLEPAGAKKFREDVDRFGSAWLPCNPLAIVEHARALFGDTAFLRVSRVDGQWRMTLMRDDGGDDFTSKAARHECPHTATIALLREVVG